MWKKKKEKKTRPWTNYEQVAALLFRLKCKHECTNEQVVIRKLKWTRCFLREVAAEDERNEGLQSLNVTREQK